MKNSYRALAALLLLLPLLLFQSCFREYEPEPKEWNPEWDLPIVRADLSMADLTNLQNLKGNVTIMASQLNPMWNGPAFVPPISGLSTENSPALFQISDYFEEVSTDSMILTVTFTNGYPIDFGKGSQLVFRNQEDGKILHVHSLKEQLDPGESYEFDIEILRGFNEDPLNISNNIEFYLDDFRSNGSNGEVVDFSGAAADFVFELKFLKVLSVKAQVDQTWTDTIIADLSLGENPYDSVGEGSLDLYVNHGLPLNLFILIEVLDENNQVTDRLFDTLDLLPADVNQVTGEVNQTQKTSINIPLERSRVISFFKGIKLRTVYNLNTKNLDTGGNNFVLFGQESDLKFQLVGHFDIDGSQISQ